MRAWLATCPACEKGSVYTLALLATLKKCAGCVYTCIACQKDFYKFLPVSWVAIFQNCSLSAPGSFYNLWFLFRSPRLLDFIKYSYRLPLWFFIFGILRGLLVHSFLIFWGCFSRSSDLPKKYFFIGCAPSTFLKILRGSWFTHFLLFLSRAQNPHKIRLKT